MSCVLTEVVIDSWLALRDPVSTFARTTFSGTELSVDFDGRPAVDSFQKAAKLAPEAGRKLRRESLSSI